MSYELERLIERFGRRAVVYTPIEVAGSSHAVVIRPASDADLPLLHDLAELDSSAPLVGAALVAVVDGRPWAAHGLDDDRVIADPFRPSAAAVGLLRLRVGQLRAAQTQTPRGWRRLAAGRVRASSAR